MAITLKRLALCLSMLSFSAPGAASAAPDPLLAPVTPVAPTAVPAAETLEAVSSAFADARAKRDNTRLMELTLSLLPSNDELKRVLRAGVDTDAFLKKYEANGIRDSAKAASKELLRPGKMSQTVVKVHSATTEQLAEYKAGSAAFAEFPGGMQRFASTIAAAGRTWQVIEYLEPGKDAGMKFSCFTVLDGRVIMVIKPWRALARIAPPSEHK